MIVYQVIAIDWKDDNVLLETPSKKEAEETAEMYDGLALRASVVVKK